MRRRVVCLFLLFVMLPSNAIAGEMPPVREAAAQVEGIGAKAYCLIERETGRVLLAHNENEMLPMASTTKIMTALLAVESCSMDEIVTVGERAYGVTGTSMYLQLGEKLPMEQMLEGLMLRSGNDAAVAIAEHVGGSVENFAGMMNERAQEMGIDAHFVTPNGLDAPGHGASALAMARLAAAALENGDFRRIVGMQSAVVPWEGNEFDRVLTNKNRLLREYEGATGVKTGYTSKAGRCLVFSAERDGMEIVGAVLNCYTWFDSAEKLLDTGFEAYEMRTVFEKGEKAGEVRVEGGGKNAVAAVAEETVRIPLAMHEEYRVEVDTAKSVQAPVRAGDAVGTVKVVLERSGEVLAECRLIAGENVEEKTFFAALRRIFTKWSVYDG